LTSYTAASARRSSVSAVSPGRETATPVLAPRAGPPSADAVSARVIRPTRAALA
jgi:hypothetical protein